MKIEVSIGELVDKITILRIKLERIKDAKKIVNVKKEFELLNQYLLETSISETNSALFRFEESE
jgi:hypothetical protein